MEKFNSLLIKGIDNPQGAAFCGPQIAQIDLTGCCNNSCIGCWVHSPYIKTAPSDKNITLPFNKIKELIEDLAILNTEEIFLSGAGEPFMHPDILRVLRLIKGKGMRVNIITNGTLLEQAGIEKLLDIGVDKITVSAWAAAPETYVKTHPGRNAADFLKIESGLKKIQTLKNQASRSLPHIRLYNVICNLNYREINAMVDFALDVGAEFIEFQVIDTLPDETGFLALSSAELYKIREQFLFLARRCDLYFKELSIFNPVTGKDKELKEFPQRFIKIPAGFFLKERINYSNDDTKEAVRSLICPMQAATDPCATNPFYDPANNEKCCVKYRQPQDKYRSK